MSKKNKVKAFEGKFVKKNGDQRIMKFVKISDLPEEFVNSKIKGPRNKRKLNESSEVVWELDEGFRVFNWKTVIGEVREFFVEKNKFLA
mgnify:CR=1 FL=1|tara:strand:- start:1336 stop:1602 length:267 start_codon:yes stop_codon:yes gene_type:complete